MHQPINHRRRDNVITDEDLPPATERAIRIHDQATGLIPLRDHLEEEIRRMLTK